MCKLLLIGSIPKYGNTGLAEAFKLLIQGLFERGQGFEIVNLTPGKQEAHGGLTLNRFIENFGILFSFILKLLGNDIRTVYFTLSMSRVGFWRDFTIIIFSWLMKCRVIAHLHGGGYKDFYAKRSRLERLFIRLALKKLDCIIVLGELLRDQFCFLSHQTKIVVVRNGLSAKGIKPKEKCDFFRIPGKAFEIIFLSNMIPSKGYFDLLYACKILKLRGVNFKCRFFGNFLGNETNSFDSKMGGRKKFDEVVSELGLEREVHYGGFLCESEKIKALENADVLALPTFYNGEGQPIAIIEAMAAGLPILSTNHSGIPEMVINGFNGYLFSPGDWEALAQKIFLLVSSEEKYQKMSKNSFRHYIDCFTPESHKRNMINLLLKKQ